MALLQPPVQPPVVAAPASDEVVARLDEELRAAVRRDGLDPQREVPAVRRLATALVREHDERSLTGVVAPVADPGALVSELVARVAGFGPLQPFLDDPTIEEVWINSPDRVFVARQGRHELTNLVLTEAQVTELVERMLKSTGRRGCPGFLQKLIGKLPRRASATRSGVSAESIKPRIGGSERVRA